MGVMPWLIFDEPTIGQDHTTRTELAFAIGHLCSLGYGVIFVTHDEDFARLLPHQLLLIESNSVRKQEYRSLATPSRS
jgi:ABC-type polar amino acid transport system ATPase subunit